ncbi:Glycosyl transferase family 2 [Halapricum desulfuricans]|uniref:Glycosyl transferase family 2 n=1 Tax=Halapricum desulfuricans TaxID=2841257 RepID=A0A897NG49_9EURY|nr:glycosyltransferase [Halapricum desulfuricans]QSG11321.1 Glycosyl transferase family 2 [Halapricum desulfuricans]
MVGDSTVSFVMPVYAGEDFVGDAIESVLAQTYDDWELVIINDGSPDDSETVIEQYLEDERIRYFTQDNKGVTETMNRGVRYAEGEYLSIHPQDDISYPDRLERQVAVLDRNPGVGLVYAPAQFVDLDGEEGQVWGDWRGEGRIPGADVFRELYVNGMFIASPSVVFRRDHITNEDRPWGDPELRVVSDWEHWMHAAQHYDAYELGTPIIRMTRDEDHTNLTNRRETVFVEERVVLERIRETYAYGTPPVTRRTFRRAVSNHHLRKLRHYLYERRAYVAGIRSGLRAFGVDPTNPELYNEALLILSGLLGFADEDRTEATQGR